ncbi:hypothetical protein [Rhodanobacter sp. C05]|uniref:hypothetical protein n=1 Tax=Rhodanobacter sp. C05 TaxID=1945855 RepID=UPI000986A764|nr:hypothetical protein [Rhodanobacter sp. C05]OOG39364.1 hypothetical protein B0E51_12545 [Rhodanobacter sp. C05]
MGARQFVAVGFRLFAIWLCVGAFQLFAITAALKNMTTTWSNPWWMGVLIVGVCVGMALIIWALSGAMARGLMSGLTKVPEVRFSPFDIVVVGCVLMGLWWLKESIVPLVILWLRAVALSSDAGQSAFTWLGVGGKLAAAMNLMQIGIGLFFVCRPYSIAKWVLRHVPVVPDPVVEPFDLLLQRTRELGVRQVARPDIVAKLANLIATHPDAFGRLPELQDLLQYKLNPSTRSTAAKTIALMGPKAAIQAKTIAARQLLEEDVPEVVKNLTILIAFADEHPVASFTGAAASPAEN